MLVWSTLSHSFKKYFWEWTKKTIQNSCIQSLIFLQTSLPNCYGLKINIWSLHNTKRSLMHYSEWIIFFEKYLRLLIKLNASNISSVKLLSRCEILKASTKSTCEEVTSICIHFLTVLSHSLNEKTAFTIYYGQKIFIWFLCWPIKREFMRIKMS